MTSIYAVKHVMSKPLITIDIEKSGQDAIKLMTEKNIGSLIVTERSELMGIVTERDILKKCCRRTSCQKDRISEIMSTPLITIDAESPLGVAMETMINREIRRLLVTEHGKIQGIVTEKDLMRGTLEALYAMKAALSTV